ncbi:MAG: response regulator [Candidatus Omnitrophica bacterium]|nr:response regulator [Candidatus Omnitrophota bacterium]
MTPPPRPPSGGAAPSPPIRVLLIEDDPGDADLVKIVLAESANPKFQVTWADRLKAGLDALARNSTDVVLSDLGLPDSRGIETFLRVHAQAPAVPIVLMTGFDDETFALEAVRHGAQDYLVKGSVDGKLLSRVIRYAIERKRAEEELSRLASFPELNPNPILEVDLAGQVTYSNPATRTQFPDLPALAARHPLLADAPAIIGQLQQSHRLSSMRELTIGSRIYEQQFYYVQGDRVARTYVQDVTERKQVEQMKDDFVGTVSHELRTPLSITREGISQVLDGLLGPVSERQVQILQIARNQMDRLARIINALLDISKLEAGRVGLQRARVDLAALIRQATAGFEPRAAEKRLTLTVTIPPGPLEVYGDADKLVEVFTNLVGNAMKFTTRGGVEIAAAPAAAGWVECRVADTGLGIAAENLPKVFNRFQQFGRPDAAGGELGTGLGLAITKGLVELHHGTIRVESRLGQGTTFFFTLPAYSVEMVLAVHLKDAVQKAAMDHARLSVLLIRVPAGGPAPAAVMDAIQGALRDRAGRAGVLALPAPEGAVVLLAETDRAGAAKVAAQIEQAVVECAVSWRGATYPDEARTAEELLAIARAR